VPTDPDLRKSLRAAADHLLLELTPTATSHAQTIQAALAPGGWKELRDTDEIGTETNLAIPLPESIRDQIVAAAEKRKITVTYVVNQGFEKFLAGEFEPRPRVRGRDPRTTSEKKVNLNVRPKAALHGQVRESGILPIYVAGDYLMSYFLLGPYAPDYAKPLTPGATRNPMISRAVRDQIRERAADLGRTVDQDIEEGFRKYLAGEFTPNNPVWPGGTDLAGLKVKPNDELFDEVKVAARDKRPVLRPMQIGLAYLLHKYGIDPAVAAE
jgi:hypothetical protein